MTWAIKFEEVSKRYQSDGRRRRHPYLRDDLSRLGQRMLSAIRPVSTGNKSVPGPRGTLALDRATFEIAKGESLALIGPNGAGKTTALRLLTRITYPTGGRIRVRGRVAALIEVTAGIHPELTGRENIWLYGRILGMSRQNIARHFDEIVEFAEVPQALDMPVKMYSSGMALRLGFSIASHLAPDIFVVDEALSVGDAAFQARSVNRMMQLTNEGRTLLFVSHHLPAVRALCRRGIFLLGGRVEMIGTVEEVLDAYLTWVDTRQMAGVEKQLRQGSPSQVTIEEVTFLDAAGNARRTFYTGEDIKIRLKVHTAVPLHRPTFAVSITDGRPAPLIQVSTAVNGQTPDVIEGSATISCHLHRVPLMPQVYQAAYSISDSNGVGRVMGWRMIGVFRITDPPSETHRPLALTGSPGICAADSPIHVENEWTW